MNPAIFTNPQILSALIGAGSNLLNSKMNHEQEDELVPLKALQSINPGQGLQQLGSDFMVPGMQSLGIGQRLLGGM